MESGPRFQIPGFRKKVPQDRIFPAPGPWNLEPGTRGFTLIEMIVAVGLFAIVMMICVDVLLSLTNANRKAQALQSVMNNLNIALDSMARSIREGENFHCGSTGNYAQPQDCSNGDTFFSFDPYGKPASQWRAYYYDPTTKAIYREDAGQSAMAITAPEVTVDELEFFVVGTTPGDTYQPKVIIVVEGSAGALGTSARTTFHIQTTAVQRVLDL